MDAYEEDIGSCNGNEEGICAKKRESVRVVKRRERGGEGSHKRTTKKGIHLAVKVTTNGTCILCGKEG